MATILRILLAAVLATCSPAWCACVLAQPAENASLNDCAEHESDGDDDSASCDDEAQVAFQPDCCDCHGSPGEASEPGDDSGDCDCSCCAVAIEFSAARGIIGASSFAAFALPPMLPVIARIHIVLTNAPTLGRAGASGDDRDGLAASPGGGSLVAQSCLLLI